MKGWYLLCYDIRDPRRLRRFHYRLSKRAIALQESVFLLRLDDRERERLERLVAEHTHSRKDDLRLYPIRHPNGLWTAGIQHHALAHLAGAPRRQPGPSLLRRLWRTLFGG